MLGAFDGILDHQSVGQMAAFMDAKAVGAKVFVEVVAINRKGAASALYACEALAGVVIALVKERLPQLPIDATFLATLPKATGRSDDWSYR